MIQYVGNWLKAKRLPCFPF